MVFDKMAENFTNKAAEKLLGKTDFLNGLKNLNTDIISGKNKEVLNLDKQADQITTKGQEFLNTETMFGKIGELLGINRAYELVKNIPVIGDMCKKTHIKNISENISGLDKSFTTGFYTNFNKNKQTTISQADSIWVKTGLDQEFDDSEDPEQIAIKAKIPEDFVTMQKTIIENLTDDNIKSLNINTVKLVSPDLIKIENGKEVVDTDKIKSDIPGFAENYIKIIVPILAKQDFIKSPNVDKDTFALAVFGNLIGDKFFIEGINLGIVKKDDYLDKEVVLSVVPEVKEETEKTYIETIANKFTGDEKDTIIKYGPVIFQEAKKYDETKDIIPTIFTQIEKESGRKPKAENKNGEDSIGLMQINKEAGHLDEAKKLGLDINTPEGNIGYGIFYLAKCIKEKGNINDGLDLYNGGGNFTKPVAERYSTSINSNLEKYDIQQKLVA